jgi:hypothetical protein
MIGTLMTSGLPRPDASPGPNRGDGLIVAKEIDMAKGYAKFGPAPLAAFPMPAVN